MFWKKTTLHDQIVKTLGGFVEPSWVDGIVVQDGQALITLEIEPHMHSEIELSVSSMEKALERLRGIRKARVILTAERKPQAARPAPVKTPINIQEPVREVAPQVKQIIAVASGKGGVGKSTVAVNLALSLQQQGLKVGILDADVYGPSVPMLLGLRDQKPHIENDYLIPLEAFGLKVMSMGFLVKEDAPMVWRGPMVQSALLQMLRDVQWGPLDILVIDMPPGTGDTQLTIAQRVKLAGAVIVSTPQDVALLDTVKGVHMFEKVAVPILGIIENMSFFCCPHCGQNSDIFGTHGARDRAKELNVEFLGGIPIDIDLRKASDEGKPVMLQQEHPVTKMFGDIAEKIIKRISEQSGNKPAPVIIIES